MRNTSGVVALMNMSREKKDISMILCSIQTKVLNLSSHQNVLSMFSKFWTFFSLTFS